MYSIQALWTAAHHDLAVVFVILNNREYRILKHNMDTYRQRFGASAERWLSEHGPRLAGSRLRRSRARDGRRGLAG